jgi:hypothetical protein
MADVQHIARTVYPNHYAHVQWEDLHNWSDCVSRTRKGENFFARLDNNNPVLVSVLFHPKDAHYHGPEKVIEPVEIVGVCLHEGNIVVVFTLPSPEEQELARICIAMEEEIKAAQATNDDWYLHGTKIDAVFDKYREQKKAALEKVYRIYEARERKYLESLPTEALLRSALIDRILELKYNV